MKIDYSHSPLPEEPESATTTTLETTELAEAVHKGLSAMYKHLDSRFFYDKKGDEIFRQIMRCEEYYPARCEAEILKTHAESILQIAANGPGPFDIVELGAGDASKSRFLLEKALEMQLDFTYYPIDISENVIRLAEQNLPKQMPGLKVSGLNGDYFDMIAKNRGDCSRRALFLFLGSSIGNFDQQDTVPFFRRLRTALCPHDLLLTGMDLKKDPATILAAYNDKDGLTKDFNLNLLKRINRELKADFDLEAFRHYPTYDPQLGACKSFLISTKDQEVTIQGKKYFFEKHEPIHMEVSQKYSKEEIRSIAADSGFTILENYTDKARMFVDTLWAIPRQEN